MQVWLTVAEAAPILKMSEQAIYSAVREQQLPEAAILRIGRRIRIDPTALRAVLDNKNDNRDEARLRDVG